jgi:hypothetical protein
VSHHARTTWPKQWQPDVRWPAQREVPDLSWQEAAACRDASDELSERLVESTVQSQVADLAGSLCRTCPARIACFDSGIAMRASGTWGGVVMSDGAVRQAATA